ARVGDLAVDARKPAFHLENGELVLEPLDMSGMVEGIFGYPARRPVGTIETVKDALYRGSAFYRAGSNAWFRLTHRSSLLDPPDATHRRAEPPEAREAWAVVEALFRRLKADVARDGARLGLVVIPERSVIEPGVWDQLLERNGLAPADWDQTLPNAHMAAICQRVAVPCLDGIDALRAAAPGLYFPKDSHLNARGSRVLADAVVPWMIGIAR